MGFYLDANNDDHGFLYRGGSYFSVDVPGALRTDAYGVNDSGQIVGSYVDANFIGHGFIATPTPEPSAVILAIIGAFNLLGYWWRCSRSPPDSRTAATPASTASHN